MPDKWRESLLSQASERNQWLKRFSLLIGPNEVVCYGVTEIPAFLSSKCHFNRSVDRLIVTMQLWSVIVMWQCRSSCVFPVQWQQVPCPGQCRACPPTACTWHMKWCSPRDPSPPAPAHRQHGSYVLVQKQQQTHVYNYVVIYIDIRQNNEGETPPFGTQYSGFF